MSAFCSLHRNARLLDMTIRTINVPTLKSLKNSVIGSPTAKAALARDEAFVRLSVPFYHASPAFIHVSWTDLWTV